MSTLPDPLSLQLRVGYLQLPLLSLIHQEEVLSSQRQGGKDVAPKKEDKSDLGNLLGIKLLPSAEQDWGATHSLTPATMNSTPSTHARQ